MPDSIYNFGCTFAVRKHDDCKLSDMDLAYNVMVDMKLWLERETKGGYHFVIESIHPIMIGPEGGTPVDE